SELPSPADPVVDPSPSLECSAPSQPVVVGEPTPALVTPPLAELPQLHDPHSPLPEPESSFVEPAVPSPEPAPSNPSPLQPPVLDPHPLCEPTSGSGLRALPEPPLSKTVSPELSEPAVLPEPSELLQSIPAPNTSLGPNACSPDVSLPLEPSPSPRLSPLSNPPLHLGPAELPEPSPLLNPSNLHDSSPLISPPLFEPSPWPGLSVVPKPPSPSSLPVLSSPEPPSDHPYLPEPSPSSNPGPLPEVRSVPESVAEPELPPTEDLLGSEQPAEPGSAEVGRPDDSQGPQGLQITPDHRHIRGTPDPLSPWGSLRLSRSPDVQRTLDDELPKSSLLFDYASLSPDSPSGSRTPLSRLPMLPEDPSLPEYAPPLEDVQSGDHTERSEGDELLKCVDPLRSSVEAPFAVLPQHSGAPRSPSPVEEPQLSQRSSLSEIPSLSDFAPPPSRSDSAPQHIRTATLASEPRAASGPSKSRPRSQLKPLRLSLLHGLGTLSPNAMITPGSANTVTPSPGLRSDVATPTPTAMYPTPSSAHPTQVPANPRSAPQSPPAAEETSEANAMTEPAHEPSGLDSVSWFGSKKVAKRGTLSAARKSEPHTPSKRKDHRHYMKIPNTAPLSISPRRVSPSIMQRAQDEGSGSYEQDVSSQDEMQLHATPHTATLDLRLRMPQKEGTNGPWMAEYFTKSPSSFNGSQFGSMHSASSSLSTGAKVVANRRNVASNKLVNGPVLVEDETFGNPGPGPSTMKTYSERRQSAEILGSPIALQTSPRERASSVPKTPQKHAPTETARRMSSQLSSRSMDATPRKAQGAVQFKVSSAEPITETEMSTNPGILNATTQSPIQSISDEVSPTEQRTPYKALSLSSPSPGRQPATPLTTPSPLQILRRNLMARTSPESPRFLSPQTRFTNLPETRPFRHQHHASASLAPTIHMRDEFRNAPMSAPGPRDRRSLTPNTRFAATPSIPGSPAQSMHSTISQAKPLLFFAIAKNSAQEVERLLQDGEVKPNDKAGPEDLPALAFALANEQLSDKTQIVKSLLSHGADPSSVLHPKTGSGQFDDADLALTTRIEQGMNPAIRYYLNRKQMTIPAPQAELLEKNNFGGLTRAGFSIIGQDAALEELIRVVAGHCRRQALNPLVVVFSGGPGCGKSLLASKIGPLLHVPYFTVNMTNLRNEAALFNYISMTAKVGQPQIPLVDFLRNNQGQRCVVVLEEIEKAADKTVWHSLLMPWEWGKATVISPTTNEQIDIDTSQVIWIATSNSGDDATLKFFAERSRPTERGESALVRLAHNPRPKEDNFTRKDYLQLMQAVRKRLGELLGSSMISRVSSVLPFLPFTEDEVYALASESLSAMRSEQKGDQSYEDVDWEELLQQAVGEYIPGEGARSVHRAVQRAFDEIAGW
ncbi:hypothetical protein FRC11_002544, partial [Ceratobasidium sp. 423]